MRTPPVSFDPITDIPRYVDSNDFHAKLDDKSGYDHISLTEDSRTFFGISGKVGIWHIIISHLVGAQVHV